MSPGRQVQTPAWHVLSYRRPAHASPHCPQLLGSSERTAQTFTLVTVWNGLTFSVSVVPPSVVQSVAPTLQSQVPAAHVALAPHHVPHVPQLLGS